MSEMSPASESSRRGDEAESASLRRQLRRPTELPPEIAAKLEKRKRFPRARRWLFNFAAALSALFCVAVIVAWGLGMAHKRIISPSYPLCRISNVDIGASCERGGFVLYAVNFEAAARSSFGWFHWEGNIFLLPSFDYDPPWSNPGYRHDLVLPYWLFILLFAFAPTVWLRRRYVERREKKFFEEIVAAKRAEQKAKE